MSHQPSHLNFFIANYLLANSILKLGNLLISLKRTTDALTVRKNAVWKCTSPAFGTCDVNAELSPLAALFFASTWERLDSTSSLCFQVTIKDCGKCQQKQPCHFPCLNSQLAICLGSAILKTQFLDYFTYLHLIWPFYAWFRFRINKKFLR